MFTVKKEAFNKDDLLVTTTETYMSFFKDTVNVFYNVRKDGFWYRVHNDRLETAMCFLNGTENKYVGWYVKEMTETALDWFLKYTLPKAV